MMDKARRARLLVGVLGILLLVSFFPLAGSQPASASPDRLKWSAIETPSGKGYVVATPSEINTFVMSANDTFYALDIPTWHDDNGNGSRDPNETGMVYKSTDAGVTWKNDTTQALIKAGAKLPAWDIAVAPDNPDFMAVVTNNRTAVYTSEDGGDKWKNTTYFNLNNTLISDIAISLEYEETDDIYRDIAIGTRNPTSPTNGGVWTTTWIDRFISWADQKLKADITTVRFSPNYNNDEMLFAIASWANGTYLCSGQRYTVSETHDSTDWKTLTEISAAVGASPEKNEVIFSDLALPSDQDFSTKNWIAYASYYSNTTYDDVYLLEIINDKGAGYRLNVTRGTGAGIASIDYIVNKDMLIAGEVSAEAKSASALIHNCTEPLLGISEPPDWKIPTKPPTGGAVSGRANALVRWTTTGSILYCATSTNNVTTAAAWANTTLPGPWSGNNVTQPDESAFSRSNDNGDSWNQLSLIDTRISRLWDYASCANNSVLYLASVNNFTSFNSLWRTGKTATEALTETWERVLCFSGKANIILRSTPEGAEKERIYFAVPGTQTLQYSEDRGQSWTQLSRCPEVTDIAVVGDKLVYILSDEMLNKYSWNEEKWGGVWEWKRDLDTGLKSGAAVIAYDTDNVLVSEKDGNGRIAYSNDGGETFSLTTPLPRFGNEMYFTPDEEFSINPFIYAASDGSLSDVYRWTIGGARAWKELNRPTAVTTGLCGLVHKGGVLYGAFQLQEGIARLLIPHLENIRPSDWDTLPSANITIKLGSLKATVKENVELWAIDDRDYFNGDVSRYDNKTYNTVGRLWTYTDAFSLQTPWANSPPPPATDSMPCDVCTCEAVKFCFSWRMLPSTEKYDLWIALDEDFTDIIHKEENITPVDQYSPTWCPDSDSLRFICGETYYWKVRSCEGTEGYRIHSRWSPPLKFKVKECSSEEGVAYLAPLLLTPAVGSKDIARSPVFTWEGFPPTTEYELILARDEALTDILVQEKISTTHYQYQGELDWGATYYWRVRATAPVSSDSSVGVFTVMTPKQPAQTLPTPPWVWVIIIMLTFLDVLLVAYCLRRR